MKTGNKCFLFSKNSQHGNMLVELLLSIALAAVIIPFAFRYQQNAVARAENIAITNQMTEVQVALERYIVAHREKLLQTVGKNITRVELSDLTDFGLPLGIIENVGDKYQLRILKSDDVNGQAALQGVIVRATDDITPLRTREIVSMGGDSMGFVEGTHAYGTYGAWHADTLDLGLDTTDGIIETTTISQDNALYLWRVPSINASDAKMLSPLNLGGHDIANVAFFDADYAEFNEKLITPEIVTQNLIFNTRTTLDKRFDAKTTTVAGSMTSDAKNMEISGSFTLADLGKFSSVAAENLWVSNMTLGGLSIEAEDDLALMKINQSLDMTAGRINAIFVTVGYTGSITPRLIVSERIEDSTNPNFFWDVDSKTAHLSDVSFAELNRMAELAVYYERDNTTYATQLFGAVAANENATVADFMNAITEIQSRVRSKYRLLNLE